MSSHRSGRQQARDLRSLNEIINKNVTLALAEFKAKEDKKKLLLKLYVLRMKL